MEHQGAFTRLIAKLTGGKIQLGSLLSYDQPYTFIDASDDDLVSKRMLVGAVGSAAYITGSFNPPTNDIGNDGDIYKNISNTTAGIIWHKASGVWRLISPIAKLVSVPAGTDTVGGFYNLLYGDNATYGNSPAISVEYIITASRNGEWRGDVFRNRTSGILTDIDFGFEIDQVTGKTLDSHIIRIGK